MLESGEGVDKNKEDACRCYGLASAQGLAPAMFNLAALYDNGEGVEKDEAAAVGLYMQAAELGHRGAQFTIGFYFERGMGLRRSRSNAVRWYRAAAAQGDALAQQALRRLGVVWEWLQMRTRTGCSMALFNVNNIHFLTHLRVRVQGQEADGGKNAWK
jgi:TPR repeat protein